MLPGSEFQLAATIWKNNIKVVFSIRIRLLLALKLACSSASKLKPTPSMGGRSVSPSTFNITLHG